MPSAAPDMRTEKSPTRTACRDRKSTRLNSSHLGISYAVFCLKKKKKKKIVGANRPAVEYHRPQAARQHNTSEQPHITSDRNQTTAQQNSQYRLDKNYNKALI